MISAKAPFAPLFPPQETFLDDPLRALRCIRFASRFGFETVPEVGECLKKTEIHVRICQRPKSTDLTLLQDALVSKVSRERVGGEVSKMMKGVPFHHHVMQSHTS